MLTNKYNLPQPVYDAIANDPYRSVGDISTTRLIAPPRIVQLEKRYRDQIEEDISERVFSLVGQNTHAICERMDSANCIVEQRFFLPMRGWLLSGQIDVYEIDSWTLSDYKVTSLWAVKEVKPEHEQQLNINAQLMRAWCGFPVERLQIVAFLRDWSKLKAKQGGDYPPCQVKVLQVPVWKNDKTIDFIIERVELHQEAEELADDKLPECTPEERWEKPTTYAVMRQGRKSAVRVLDSADDAEAYMQSKGFENPEHWINERTGESTRCENYCSVNKWCSQYKEMMNGQLRALEQG